MKTEIEIIRDLTNELNHYRSENRLLKKQKEEYQNYFEIFIQNAADVLFIYNLKTWKTEFISPSIKTITGYTIEEALNHTLDQVMTKDSFDHIVPLKKERIEQLLNGEIHSKLFIDELIHLKKDGSEYFSESYDFYTTKKDGTPIIVGILRDVDERKKLEIAQKETNKRLSKIIAQKDKLFAVIGHDLRGPIGSVMGLLEVLEFEFDKQSETDRKRIIKSSLNGINNVYNLLNDLLEWGKISNESIKIEKERFNIQAILDDVYRLMSPIASNKNISINFQLSNFIINCNKNVIKVILRNLLSNAIKFTNRGGNISLCLKEKDGYSYISVKDNGVGISNKRINNLFNLSTTISTEGTEQEKGTGLGLHLVHEFVERCEGKISVKSRLGVGTEFIIKLPN
ncbi:MAG: hypothetical protein C0598_14175 [Marinilabiliales bacterium]|nr:MAG: hypothetical protein C0598_14175 [Marinilabiliales bacterium]